MEVWIRLNRVLNLALAEIGNTIAVDQSIRIEL